MKEFDELIEITDILLGPEGCPWDREQTFDTIRTTVLEEVHELIEAIHSKDKQKILEELGDLFFNAIFFCKLGEKENLFTTQDVIHQLSAKLIRRHPHIFGEQKTKINTVAELHTQWESIKAIEDGGKSRKSKLDGIPENLPALARAQKMLKKLKKTNYKSELNIETSEERLGAELFKLVEKAQTSGIDAELALLKIIHQTEDHYRKWESEET